GVHPAAGPYQFAQPGGVVSIAHGGVHNDAAFAHGFADQRLGPMPCAFKIKIHGVCPPGGRGSKLSTIRNGHPAAPSGLQCSRLSVQHGRSASFASSLAALPASLGSSAAIAATG